MNALSTLGINAHAGAQDLALYGIHPSRAWSLPDILSQHEMDVAVITLWFWDYLSMPEHYMAAIRELSPRCVIAVLTDDRHGLRQQQAAIACGSVIVAESATDYLEREAAAYQASDVVLAIAAAERNVVRALSPATPTVVIPFAVSPQSRIAPLSRRSGILFLANFLNSAAQDAAAWFLREAWAAVREQLPQARLTLAGTFSKDFMKSTPPGVECRGHVASLAELFNSHRVFVSPVRFGTGISTRNILSMSYGLPVVTTPYGAQSLAAENELVLFSCEKSEEIAAAIVRLCIDDGLWQRMSDASRQHSAQQFSVQSLRRGIHEFIATTSRLDLRRKSKPQFSCRMIDQEYPELSTCDRPEFVRERRIAAYIDQGENLVRCNEYRAAARQFRHACSLLQIEQPVHFVEKIKNGLNHCYRALGDSARVASCAAHQPG